MAVPEQVDLIDPSAGSVVGSSRDPGVADELSARTFNAVDTHVAVSADSSTAVLYVPVPDSPTFASGLAAFSLPNLAKQWHLDQERSVNTAVFVGDGAATTFDDVGTPAFGSAAGAVDLATGDALWNVAGSALCTVSGSVAVLVINDQLVFVSTADGRQIYYEPTIDECPERVGDVLVVEAPGRQRHIIAVDQGTG